MYPAWKSTFDAHIYEGRVLQVVLMKTAEEPLAEATVGVSVLAERCKKGNGCAEFWVDLQPSGKVQMVVQFFVEDTDTAGSKPNKQALNLAFIVNLSLSVLSSTQTHWL